MTIFIDSITTYPEKIVPKAHQNKWSHLWTDEKPAVLHNFAKRIGLSRSWFQNKEGFPHYDIVPIKRDQALKNGAICVSLKDWLRENKS